MSRIAKQVAPALVLAVLCPWLFAFSLTDGAEEKAEFIEGLRRDIIKVDHSIEVTKDLIKKSKGAKFLPDIIFRLAELYVEKSRLVYYLEVETRGQQAASSAEAKLLKNEAITVYNDVLKNFPEYRYADKVLFFMGHEYHELGMHEDMLDTYKKLVEEYPKSTLLLEALYIIGDYYFNRDKLDEAEEHFKKILEYRESPIHDMARYKLAWVAINRARIEKKYWKVALKLFEKVVLSGNTRGEVDVDLHKSVNIRLEALNGIVFCYTEVYKPKMALQYFRKLADSKNVYLHALEKLANRYFIKEQFGNAAMMYRRIIDLSNDVEKNLDYAQRVYDASTFSKKKDKVDEDVRALVKAASKYTYSWRIPDSEKKQLAKEFEVYARDIVTKLHLLAQKRDEKRAFRIAARAYDNYLSFFDYSEELQEVKFNHAESLYHSEQYLKSARAYEDIVRDMEESKERKETLYSCIQSFQYALAEAKYLSRFELVEARQGLKQLGAYYVKKYPKDEKVPTIKFNVARMFYDQGEYEEAIESFLEYIKQYPAHSEVPVAGHLVLDSYKQLEDYAGLAEQGRALVSDPNIKDAEFKKEVAAIIESAENRELDQKTLEVTKEGGDAVEALLQYAGTVSGGQAEEAIYRSFVMAKEKRNIEMAFKAGAQIASQYEKSKHLKDVYATLGNFSAQMADFERAAALYEDFFKRFPNQPEAREAMRAAASFQSYLGNYRKAIKAYRQLSEKARGDQKGRLLVEIADAYAKLNDWRMVLATASQAVSELPSSVKAQLLLGKAQEQLGKIEQAKNSFMAAATSGGQDDLAISAEAQFRLAEILLDDFRKIRFGAGQEDVAVIQNKMQLAQMIDQFLAGVVELKNPQWAIAALYRLADMYEEFASFLADAPVPADLTDEQKQQYKQMIEQQVDAQKQQAKTYLDACRQAVRSKKVFGKYAMACITGELSATAEQTSRRRGSRVTGERVDALKAKLLKNPNDLDTLDELAMLALAGGDLHYAQLVLSKALEIDENRASSTNLMGAVEQYRGNDQDAYDLYNQASKLDRQYLPARLNMAGLFIKYRDEARAKAVLKNVAGKAKTADLSSSAIHPSAKQALSALRIR